MGKVVSDEQIMNLRFQYYSETNLIFSQNLISYVNWLEKKLSTYTYTTIGSLSCNHNFIAKDSYWKSCTHCGTIEPIRK